MSAMSTVPVQHPSERLRGILPMIAAVFVFAIMDAALKHLSSQYSSYPVSCMRCVSSLVFLLVSVAVRGSWAQLRMRSPWLHGLRALLGFGTLVTFMYAVRRLSLGETYAVCLCAPLLMTAMSVPLHREYVPPARWVAIGVGLAGVLLILKPSPTGFHSLAALGAAALCALFYAGGALMVRTMSRNNSSTGMVFWFLVLVGFATGVPSLADWHPIPAGDWAWLVLIGATGVLGQYWVTDAFRHAPPSVVGPFEYTSILWAFAIDWIFWSARPTAALIGGATIVIASGVYVIWDEPRLSQLTQLAMTPATPPP